MFCTDLGGGGWDISAYVSTDRLFHGHLHISEYPRHVFGHDGLPAAHVIYGGVDTTRFSPGSASAPPIDCLFVGRLLPHKGVDVMLEAVPADFDGRDRPGAGLALPRRSARARAGQARDASGTTATTTPGRGVSVRAVSSCCRASIEDRYGGTTRVPELLGQTLLEGMACGTPGLCTQRGQPARDGRGRRDRPCGRRPAIAAALGERCAGSAIIPMRAAARWARPAGRACSEVHLARLSSTDAWSCTPDALASS